MCEDLSAEVKQIQSHIEAVRTQKRDRLENLDLFCLDNSIRESTVGQIRSHTLKNKIDIFNEVKKCGMKDIIVASFAHMTRVDDDFVEYLRATGEDFSRLYSFSEVSDKGVVNGVYESETIPVGLRKNIKYGIINIIFEADLADDTCEWGTKYTVDDFCKLLKERIDYVYDQISPQAKILVNLRDLTVAISKTLERLLTVVKFLSKLPKGRGIFAILFEEPLESLYQKNWRHGLLACVEPWIIMASKTENCSFTFIKSGIFKQHLFLIVSVLVLMEFGLACVRKELLLVMPVLLSP